ncbi:hypothetical protein WJX82_002191 [Trebouxia sp. C0006]
MLSFVRDSVLLRAFVENNKRLTLRSGQHIAGTILVDEVFVNQKADPYVLEVDGTLDLAALQLQPGSIVINSKKGLVDVQTSKTKRLFADIQQKILHDTAAGSMANPLHISGAPIAGLDTVDSKLDQILSLLKAKTNPKARPISEVGSAEADSVLLELGFLQDDGVSYIGGLDGVAAPWGLAIAGAVSEMRIAYGHKQSSAQKQAYQEANPQYYEGKVSKSGGEHTTFAGRRKGRCLISLMVSHTIYYSLLAPAWFLGPT